MKYKHYIDASKGLTAPAVLAIMAWFGGWQDARAWIYLALHGSYGVMWVWKSKVFPDRQWERPVPAWYGIGTILILGVFWLSPWLIVTHRTATPPVWWNAMCVALFVFGVFLHFAADMQKHVSLALRPGVLFTDGLWSRVRNPNYLGELLIYGGFSLVAYHWLPLAWLGLIMCGVWLPNMIRKDKSLSRYPAFAEWRARSKVFIPFLF
jgi:steroid 5-alpha reductase family enzyme